VKPSSASALLMANVLHKAEAPIIPHMVMRTEAYAGYRTADGSGRAVTVLDFVDERASVLFRAYRESELLQAVHRARLFRVGDAQVGLWEPLGQTVARKAAERRRVRLVIHSAHPIPGLRVDELIYDGEAGTNERRAVAAAERIIAACQQLIAEGVPLTVNAVARVTGSRKDVVSRVLASQEFVPARSLPLVITTTTKGGDRAPPNFSENTANSADEPTRGVHRPPPNVGAPTLPVRSPAAIGKPDQLVGVGVPRDPPSGAHALDGPPASARFGDAS
jgi:hypothetical protein